MSQPADGAMEARLREIVRLAPIGIGIVDLEGHTVLTNDALSGMLGYSPEEFATQTFDHFTHPDDIARNLVLFDEMVAGERDAFEMDKRFIHRDGHLVWGRLQVSLLRDEHGEPAYAIGMLLDITEQRRLSEELERLAYHDALTDLANRRLFHERLEQELRRHERDREQARGAVLFLDLDGFKRINDEHGHQAGDRVLLEVADRLRSGLRPADLGARLGGDEYAALLDAVDDLADAWQVAERVRERIERPIDLAGVAVTPAVSIGIALLREHASLDQVLTSADRQMYAAKTAARGASERGPQPG
ncbi:MAG: GGDEF domain-containing protein [Nitriliruptoraceae bacterium]|nr:GGDEF domain-containing protein [Nitriliruptoraceae bacterium]